MAEFVLDFWPKGKRDLMNQSQARVLCAASITVKLPTTNQLWATIRENNNYWITHDTWDREAKLVAGLLIYCMVYLTKR